MSDPVAEGAASADSEPRRQTSLLPKILIGLVLVVAVFVVVVMVQPAEFRVSRSETINASTEEVFTHVNDLRSWEAWSPWAKLDPEMKTTYEGSDSGEGAVYSWDGNSDVGAGRMTITESRPSEYIEFQLEFLRPFEATNTAEFTFAEKDGATEVTWSMDGNNNFIGKAFALFVDMDQMLGKDFEGGLANLKATVEGPAGD